MYSQAEENYLKTIYALEKNFSNEVQQRLRITDTCSRYGMNKIMVILPNTRAEQTENVCQKLEDEIKASDIIENSPKSGFCFSVSAGYTQAGKDSKLEELLAEAETKDDCHYEFTIC